MRCCVPLVGLFLLLVCRSSSAEETPTALAGDAPAAAEALRNCIVEPRAGVSQEEADAIDEVVCTAIRTKAPSGYFRVRVARLGAHVVLTLVGDGVEKQLVLSGLDEVPVAAPRLADALLEKKSVEDTQTVSNIVGIEARKPKKKPSTFRVEIGPIAAAALRGEGGAGANLAVSVGSERWSFVTDLRLAGYSFTSPASEVVSLFTLGELSPDPDDDAFAYASLAAGVRHHLGAGDSAVLVGLGLAYDYLKATSHADDSFGLAPYAEVGFAAFRTHLVGGTVAARVDVPAFSVSTEEWYDVYPGQRFARTRTEWTPIASVALSFGF